MTSETTSTARPPRRAGRNLPAAIGMGVAMGGVLVASLFVRREAFGVLVCAAVLYGTVEMVRAFRSRHLRIPVLPPAVGTLAMVPGAYLGGGETLFAAYALTVAAVVVYRLVDDGGDHGSPVRVPPVRDVAGGIFVVTYGPLLAGFAMLMLAASDGLARPRLRPARRRQRRRRLRGGVLFGRHPMAPSVSPKKSWEGSAGSLVIGMVAGAVALPLALGAPGGRASCWAPSRSSWPSAGTCRSRCSSATSASRTWEPCCRGTAASWTGSTRCCPRPPSCTCSSCGSSGPDPPTAGAVPWGAMSTPTPVSPDPATAGPGRPPREPLPLAPAGPGQLVMSAPRRGKPPRHFVDLEPAERGPAMVELGEKAFRGKQLATHWFERLEDDPEKMTDLPAASRSRIADALLPTLLTPIRTLTADQGTTVKTLYRMHDGALVESVLMRYKNRDTLCISSQAGCGMNCPFCATGQAGLTRNLSTAEIVEQVTAASRALARGEVPGGEGRVGNVVFMGMGEALANYKSAVAAVRRLTQPAPDGLGISARGITMSTVGLVPAIDKFAGEGIPRRWR